MEYLNHSDYLKLSKAKQKEHDKQWALHMLDYIKPSDVIYTTVKHVSSSGMSRNIAVYTVQEGKIKDISYFVSNLIGWSRAKDGSIKVSGCGMDMGFHLVYTFSTVLFNGTERAGYALKQEWL